ncbi:hypothetical protein [Nostoc sp. ChiSLP03a]|nr:hypothetical protein [Nostoc sp. ChiSLP03a]MDZ8214373.1 hypothetical protein [Nostoc sp. ChiSLP03a]
MGHGALGIGYWALGIGEAVTGTQGSPQVEQLPSTAVIGHWTQGIGY